MSTLLQKAANSFKISRADLSLECTCLVDVMQITFLAPYDSASTVRSDGSQESCAESKNRPQSDGQLVASYLHRREEGAFAQLVTRFGPLVYAVALRTLRDSHAADDVFQATFLILARDAAKIRSPESVGAWLHRTALRIAKRALVRRRKERLVDDFPHLMSQQSLLDEMSEQFEQQLVDEELQRLPPAYRAPLVLHFLEGLTCEETAAALGTTVGAVRGRLQRGKRELQLRLMRRGVAFTAVMTAVVGWQSVAVSAVRPSLFSSAIQGGMAIAHGASLPSVCSSEAVHLATKETAMFTTGKVLLGSAALLSTALGGWCAHAAVEGNCPGPVPSLLTPSLVQQRGLSDEMTRLPGRLTLNLDDAVAYAGADDSQKSDQDAAGNAESLLKYDDGRADGKRSIAGTGEMIRFTLPDKSQKLRNLRVHSARYGSPKPPDENAEVTIVSEDGKKVVHTELVPYSTFKRGDSRWTTIRFEEPIEVPETFWVILQFHAERTKGVYVSYDTSTGGEHSRTGVPGGEMTEVNTDGDWMVRAVLTEPK